MPYSINSPPSTPRKTNKGAPLTLEDSPTPKDQAVVAPIDVTPPSTGTAFNFDLDSPPLAQLKPTKEIDSGVPAWETPSPSMVDSASITSTDIPPATQTIAQFRQSLEIWQTMLPGRFCIFVGNIPYQHDDAILAQGLLLMFTSYGACSAAVNRGREIVRSSKPNSNIDFSVDRRIPYGHVQFDNFDSALNAVNQTRGPHTMDGRMLRIEFNRTNRNVLVFTAHLSIPAADVVVAHLSQYGRIESVRPTTVLDRAHELPVGLRVRFDSHVGAQKMQRMVGPSDFCFHYRYKI